MVCDKFEKYSSIIFFSLLGISMVFLLFWIHQTMFWYQGDMEKIYLNAINYVAGNYIGWEPEGYLYRWPHQNGLTLLIVILLRFFNDGQIFELFYYFNVISYLMVILLSYSSLKLLFPQNGVAQIQGIFIMLFLPMTFFCMQMYGNMIGFAWGVGAVYFVFRYLQKNNTWFIIIAAFCMMMSIIFKQNYLIIMIGLLFLLCFDAISVCIKTVFYKIVKIILFLVIVLIGIQLPSLYFSIQTGLEISTGNSKFAHIAMGLQETENIYGWYNTFNDNVFIENQFDTYKTAEASKRSIEQSLQYFASNSKDAWSFFNHKLASEWNNPTFESFHIQNRRNTALELSPLVKSTIYDGGKINILLTYVFDINHSILLFGILLYFVTAKNVKLTQLLYAVLFIGAFLFFLCWEAKSMYVLPFFFMLIPYSFIGYQNCVLQGKLKIRFPEKAERKHALLIRHCQISGWNRIHTTIIILAILSICIAVSDSSWIRESFKMTENTQSFYNYIHQYNSNFLWLKF
jgi:hypothetical protein